MNAVRRTASLLVLLGAGLAAAAAPAAAAPECSRVYGIGDLHGGYDALVGILQKTGLVDAQKNWTGNGACLVQTGDIVDRGDRSREVLDLLMKLEHQADGRVQVLLGNHEVMNLTSDLRYVTPGEFAAYAADETDAEREAGYEAFSRLPATAELDDTARREAFEKAHPPGWFAHGRAFSPGGRYWDWLAAKRIVTVVEGTLFVHGGLGLQDARIGIDALNAQATRDLRRFVELREALERSGVLNPLMDFAAGIRAVRDWLESGAAAAEGGSGDDARAWLALLQSPIFRSDGPLWDRRFAEESGEGYGPSVDTALGAVGARRVAVGHTTTEDHLVHARFGDRVFLMDTGAGPAYGGRISALEVARNGRVRAIYADDEVTLGRPDRGWLERALAEGEILESRPMDTGVTRPEKLLIAWDGERIPAVFKAIDVEEPGLTQMKGAKPEINFTDSYRWELGAYLLDRELGLAMVPVAVERRIDGRKGAVIEWIEDAMSETQRIETGIPTPPDAGRQQKISIMLLFDGLIYNVDRNPGNYLWTRDWQLYLIDHSRSFRIHKDLPENVEATDLRLPRSLYERLRALDLATLAPALAPAVDKGRVKSLLKRRDALVAKIEAQRKAHGDEFVFGE